jgi:hypothetical protein
MANMSYCRFENTLGDVKDCVNALRHGEIESNGEKKKAKALLELMAEFLLEEGLISEEGEIDYEAIEEFTGNRCEE